VQKQFAQKLLKWYDAHHRALPWRRAPKSMAALDPYHVMVSEAMLQQTQVNTVIPYFQRFLAEFPTLGILAAADEQDVLRSWQGLGYYSRARNLRAAAQQIVARGSFPSTVDELLKLPGIGRYTAGAIASIAFEQRAPILDGNVMRVLCRLDRIEADPREKIANEKLWARAKDILPGKRCGDFNSALMELGATLCTPRNPRCDECPVKEFCAARAAGVEESLPRRREVKASPVEHRITFCIERRGMFLIEQRPMTGRWAAMWQFITVPANGTATDLVPNGCTCLKKLGQVRHVLTHRRYVFDVYSCNMNGNGKPHDDRARRWVKLSELARYPLSRPQLRIAEMLQNRR